jgi:hypothetical protein
MHVYVCARMCTKRSKTRKQDMHAVHVCMGVHVYALSTTHAIVSVRENGDWSRDRTPLHNVSTNIKHSVLAEYHRVQIALFFSVFGGSHILFLCDFMIYIYIYIDLFVKNNHRYVLAYLVVATFYFSVILWYIYIYIYIYICIYLLKPIIDIF